ncbi:ABC transporter substrate-binding protein [Devosia sp. 1566]|uniref:ABC transporter substrate-binding protein n=1 Tax=Devosia sp. 1566 TaxID=2499144 RepID=UPI0020BE65DF|nr:ABC transporter substrate-binding protein [Devosia sp. 1566]
MSMGVATAADCTQTVPDSALVKSGTLVMSTNPTLPPLQFINSSGELKGMRVELGEEIAKRLCLTPEYVRIEFSAMIPGLQAGRWDMINTGIFVTPERAAMMNMIAYELQAISVSVPVGVEDVTEADDLAGKVVGVEIGGFEENKTKELSADLEARGLEPMEIRTFDNFALAYQALRAGQVEAVVSIDGVAEEYDARGDFRRAISGLFPTPVALAMQNPELAKAVVSVLAEMKADGSYDALFEQYGVASVTEDFVIVAGE